MTDRYQSIPVTKLNVTGSLYYQTNIYPTIQPTDTDYYVITTIEDRLDLLAYDFYQDSSLWWIIHQQMHCLVIPCIHLLVFN